jgi:hypothetical protein
MANMEFVEHGVKNGKLYIKSVRKITPNDLKKVGSNLALILQAMIEPLTILGSDQDTFDIGGRKIANPFKNPKALKGIEMLTQISGAFKPLLDAVSEYANLGIATDPKKQDMFSKSLIVVMNSIIWAIDRAASVKTDLATKSIATISRFVGSFKDLNLDHLNGINATLEKFINAMADDIKWKRIINNLASLRKEFQGIAQSINSIDMAKAMMFEKTVKELMEDKGSDNLAKVVEKLESIFDLITTNQGGGKKQDNTATAPTPQSPFSFGFRNDEPKKKTKDKVQVADNGDLTDLMTTIGTLLNEISGKLTGVNDKLAGKLKVQTVGATPNGFFPIGN